MQINNYSPLLRLTANILSHSSILCQYNYYQIRHQKLPESLRNSKIHYFNHWQKVTSVRNHLEFEFRLQFKLIMAFSVFIWLNCAAGSIRIISASLKSHKNQQRWNTYERPTVQLSAGPVTRAAEH